MCGKRKSRRAVLIVVSVLLAILAFTGIWTAYALATRPDYTPPDTAGWRTGDIFFSVGDTWESVAVRSLTGVKDLAVADSTPSHCGIVVHTPEGLRLVHESTVAGRIVAETPEDYLHNNGSRCIYARHIPCPVDTSMLKVHIDSLLHLAVPFDFTFNHNDPRELYCTELVVRLLEMNGIDAFSDLRTNNYIYPQDLAKRCIP